MSEATPLQRWTPDEDERLKRMWERGSSDEFIASALGRTAGAVTQRRFRFGLKRDNAAGGNCEKCHRGIYAYEGALRYCLSCGHEPADSATKPITPPQETDDEEPLVQRVQHAVATRKEPEVTDIETIARQSLERVTNEMNAHQQRLEDLGAEKAKLNRVLAALEPRPGISCPECGKGFKAKNNMTAHRNSEHGVTV